MGIIVFGTFNCPVLSFPFRLSYLVLSLMGVWGCFGWAGAFASRTRLLCIVNFSFEIL